MGARHLLPLAHLGGIDEIGVFLVPALLAFLALRWAERRAKSSDSATDQDQMHDTPEPQQASGIDQS